MSDATAAEAVTDAQVADADGTPPAGTVDAQVGDPGESTSLSSEDARKLRSEARSLRQRLKAAEDQLQARADQDLSEQQRLERDLTTTQAQLEQAETRARNLQVQVTAAKVGVRADAVDVVAGLIDWAEIDDANDTKQLERAIRDVLKERPFLSGKPAGLNGGTGRGAGGAVDMNSIIRQRAGRG